MPMAPDLMNVSISTRLHLSGCSEMPLPIIRYLIMEASPFKSKPVKHDSFLSGKVTREPIIYLDNWPI